MLTITRDKRLLGQVLPEPINLLTAIPDSALFHAKHGLRHPLGIYNISVRNICDKATKALDALDEWMKAPEDEKGSIPASLGKALPDYANFLQAMNSHIDDSYSIIKTTQPPVELKDPHPFTDRWLQQAQHPTIGIFKNSFREYREELAAITNRLTHRQGRLGGVAFCRRGLRIPGYHLEAPLEDGAIGRDPSIHKKSEAISIAMDLRWHWFHLYSIGASLCVALKRALAKQQGLRIKPAYYEANDKDFIAVTRRITKLPAYVFPDEVNLKRPALSLFENESTTQVSFQMPSMQALSAAPADCEIMAEVAGDGVTKSFRIPYYRAPRFQYIKGYK